MSLAAVKSQLSAIERRLDAVQGKGKSVEYVWSTINGGHKRIHSGNPHSKARCVIEIVVADSDGSGSAPRIIIDGKRCNYG